MDTESGGITISPWPVRRPGRYGPGGERAVSFPAGSLDVQPGRQLVALCCHQKQC